MIQIDHLCQFYSHLQIHLVSSLHIERLDCLHQLQCRALYLFSCDILIRHDCLAFSDRFFEEILDRLYTVIRIAVIPVCLCLIKEIFQRILADRFLGFHFHKALCGKAAVLCCNCDHCPACADCCHKPLGVYISDCLVIACPCDILVLSVSRLYYCRKLSGISLCQLHLLEVQSYILYRYRRRDPPQLQLVDPCRDRPGGCVRLYRFVYYKPYISCGKWLYRALHCRSRVICHHIHVCPLFAVLAHLERTSSCIEIRALCNTRAHEHPSVNCVFRSKVQGQRIALSVKAPLRRRAAVHCLARFLVRIMAFRRSLRVQRDISRKHFHYCELTYIAQLSVFRRHSYLCRPLCESSHKTVFIHGYDFRI